MRWCAVAIGVLSTIVWTGWGWVLYKLTREDNRGHLDSVDVFLIVMLWTKCCMWFVIGMGSFVSAFTKWHGDVNRLLLLRLLDSQQKETVTDEHVV